VPVEKDQTAGSRVYVPVSEIVDALASVPFEWPADAGALAAACDEPLMAAFQATGDAAACEALFKRHLKRSHRVAMSILGNEAAAEDALAEAFLRLVRARRSYRPGASFAAWFYAILRNVCRDELRRRPMASLDGTGQPATGPEADPAARLEAREAHAAAARAFARLPDAEREVLALRLHGDLPFDDVAGVCGLSAEAARKRASRALARLRSFLR
jgi:RNA polymerase sigma-70 factor (ECF subfamily)